MIEPAKKLSGLRQALLALHKGLLDAQRIAYERKHGRVRSNSEFFRLVTQDPEFDWLRPLSELIVQVDQKLDEPDAITKLDVRHLLDQAKRLFRRTRSQTGFSTRFFEMIENFPHVVLAYGEVSQILKAESTPHA